MLAGRRITTAKVDINEMETIRVDHDKVFMPRALKLTRDSRRVTQLHAESESTKCDTLEECAVPLL